MNGIELLSSGPAIALEAKSGKRRPFAMDAYTGAIFDHPYLGRAVIDVSGIRVPPGGVPSLRQHDPRLFVGRCERVTLEGGRVRAEGFLFVGVDAADEVSKISDAGGKWQASIKVEPVDPTETTIEHVAAGASVRVNGASLSGPLAVMRASTLTEISWVQRGADTSTSAVALSAVALSSSALAVALDASLAAARSARSTAGPTPGEAPWDREARLEVELRAHVEESAAAFDREVAVLKKAGSNQNEAVLAVSTRWPLLHAATVARANKGREREILARFVG